MKLRKPWMVKLAAQVGSRVGKLWNCTLGLRTNVTGLEYDPWNPASRERFIYSLWHDSLAYLLTWRSSIAPMTALISQSSDGELIAQVCKCYGIGVVRGSSSRGGIEAVKQVLRLGTQSHLLIVPDGPRGPRRQVKHGLIGLASRTGMRIVPVGVGFDRAWRVKSWDRMSLPKPWSTITCVTGPAMRVPSDIGKDDVEDYRQRLESMMLQSTTAAEKWAAGEPWQLGSTDRQAA